MENEEALPPVEQPEANPETAEASYDIPSFLKEIEDGLLDPHLATFAVQVWPVLEKKMEELLARSVNPKEKLDVHAEMRVLIDFVKQSLKDYAVPDEAAEDILYQMKELEDFLEASQIEARDGLVKPLTAGVLYLVPFVGPGIQALEAKYGKTIDGKPIDGFLEKKAREAEAAVFLAADCSGAGGMVGRGVKQVGKQALKVGEKTALQMGRVVKGLFRGGARAEFRVLADMGRIGAKESVTLSKKLWRMKRKEWTEKSVADFVPYLKDFKKMKAQSLVDAGAERGVDVIEKAILKGIDVSLDERKENSKYAKMAKGIAEKFSLKRAALQKAIFKDTQSDNQMAA